MSSEYDLYAWINHTSKQYRTCLLYTSWTKYDKAYRADTYFDDSKTVGPATLNVWTANNTYTTFELSLIHI